MKVLIVGLGSDTVSLLRGMGIVLEEQAVEDPDELESWLVDGECDAAVVDLEKSGLGIYVARGLRAKKIKTPILGVSSGSEARSWGDHRAMFLENGGDDLLRNPVNVRELAASLRAATRRFGDASYDIVEHVNGDAVLKVNLTNGMVRINGEEVELTGKERDMLMLFAGSPGRTFTKESILSHLYGGMDEPEIKIVDVFVCKLRKKMKLAHADAEPFIETIWGRGYKFLSQGRDLQEDADRAVAVA